MWTIRPIVLSGMLAFACALPAAAQEADQEADTGMVVARVGDTEITLGHMIVLRQSLPARYATVPDDVLFPQILEQLIQQAALAAAAGEPSEALQLRLDNERRALVASVQVEAVAGGPVSDEELQAAYEAEYGGYEPETEYNASHILVETEEEAQAIVEALQGGADFGQLAVEKSTGPSGPSGGNLGWFGKGAMVPPFEAAVLALETGEISEPVQTQFGWHVVTLNETRLTSAPALEEVRGDLAQELQRKKIETAIDDAVAAVEVERADTSGIDASVLSDPTQFD